MNLALTDQLPGRLRRRHWEIAIGTLSRLCDGLHHGPRRAIHAGLDLGPPPRIDGRRLTTADRSNSPFEPESPLFVVGSRFFQRAGHRILATGRTPVRDAGDVSRTGTQKEKEPFRHRVCVGFKNKRRAGIRTRSKIASDK